MSAPTSEGIQNDTSAANSTRPAPIEAFQAMRNFIVGANCRAGWKKLASSVGNWLA